MYMNSTKVDKVGSPRSLSAAWDQVAAVVAAVDGALGRWLSEAYGIGQADYHAMLHLSRASDKELRISELAAKIGLNQSSVTRLVGRLESKGFVFRDTCPDDGRGVYAVVTDRGLDTVREVGEHYETRIRESLQNAAKQHPRLDLTGADRAFVTIGELAN